MGKKEGPAAGPYQDAKAWVDSEIAVNAQKYVAWKIFFVLAGNDWTTYSRRTGPKAKELAKDICADIEKNVDDDFRSSIPAALKENVNVTLVMCVNDFFLPGYTSPYPKDIIANNLSILEKGFAEKGKIDFEVDNLENFSEENLTPDKFHFTKECDKLWAERVKKWLKL